MGTGHAIRRLAAYVQAAVFGFILFNGIFFRHAHLLDNGVWVCHAHPYQADSDGPVQKHHHSATSLTFLDLISNGSHTANEFYSWVAVSFPFSIIQFESFSAYVPGNAGDTLFLRGPPVCCS
ncbi:MAG TPA: hypothetical protein VG737_03175 [Cyclobacteriaceae bacterium]|nr:hypothetical protein [Cyclobacteriaceae bacterium]